MTDTDRAPSDVAGSFDWLIDQHVGWLRVRAECLIENGEPGDEQNAEHFRNVAKAIESLTLDREVMRAETGWLIEDINEPTWLTLKPAEAMWSMVFTPESLDAIRFARRSDAEDYVACHLDDAPVRITEHSWSDPRAALASLKGGA